ncbi:MAG: sigma-70 family RNA polymerase sigma factor [Phycisphaerae bacterium]|jgi:RNA polymerase sigma factor (sigma-70 family)|nr:sigma-70 family RNA polymerase sigma factor [Phycisphaerae bacterium]
MESGPSIPNLPKGPNPPTSAGGEGNGVTTVELLGRLRSGGSESDWADLDRRYRPLAVAVARKLGLTQEDAEDVAQQAMLEFYAGWQKGEYDPSRGRLRVWLISIVRHRAIDLMRRVRLRQDWRGDSAVGVAVDDAELEGAWDAEWRRAVLAEAIVRLRTTSRAEPKTLDAFDRFALQGVPGEIVAAEIGIALEEIYRIKSRMLKRLREIIGEVERTWAD